MRLNKNMLRCAPVALLLVACGISPESLVDGLIGADKKTLSFLQDENVRNKGTKALDVLHKNKKSEFAKSFKENCSEEEMKVLDQRFSCVANAKDEAASVKCRDTHKLSAGKCANAFDKIAVEIHNAVIAAKNAP
jgi:hypothetical protein